LARRGSWEDFNREVEEVKKGEEKLGFDLTPLFDLFAFAVFLSLREESDGVV
jgi:hypothetical protein